MFFWFCKFCPLSRGLSVLALFAVVVDMTSNLHKTESDWGKHVEKPDLDVFGQECGSEGWQSESCGASGRHVHDGGGWL